MGVRVDTAMPDEVRLYAPLEPNINHRSTVFGGSAAAVAILAGWSLLHLRLGHGGRNSRIVIQSSSVYYEHPIDAAFEAVAPRPETPEWDRFLHTLRRRGRARIRLQVDLVCRG